MKTAIQRPEVLSYTFLVRAKHRVAGWVAGGCWDDDIMNVMTGIIPENSLRKTH